MTVGSITLSPTLSMLLAKTRTETGRKTVRFAAVSIVAIAISQITTLLCYGLIRWGTTRSQVAAFVVSMIPSYYLNRAWVWGKSGKSSLRKEVLPFWAIGIAQFILSLFFVVWAQGVVERTTESHALRTLGIMFNMLFIYGIMWIAKFMFFNKVLFVHRPEIAANQAAAPTHLPASNPPTALDSSALRR
jgi:putative flippase GtrA